LSCFQEFYIATFFNFFDFCAQLFTAFLSSIKKDTTKLVQFSSILFDCIKRAIWRSSCASMLSMTKHLVCKLEVLQPQPSTTVPELN